MNEYYMNIALKQATKAYINNEVPIGCVIIKNNKIIAKAYNQKQKRNNAIMHAEIIAITKACNKLKTWCLEDCIIFCTVEPCVMCIGAIIQSRIPKLVYGTNNSKFGYSNFIKNENKIMNSYIKITKGVCIEQTEEILKKFFENKRK